MLPVGAASNRAFTNQTFRPGSGFTPRQAYFGNTPDSNIQGEKTPGPLAQALIREDAAHPTLSPPKSNRERPVLAVRILNRLVKGLLHSRQTRMGGLQLNRSLYDSRYQNWQAESNKILEQGRERSWEDYAPFVKKQYQAFGLEGLKGIPPNLQEKEVNPETGKSANTRNILACIALDTLNALPLAENAEDGVAQLFATIENINKVAVRKTNILKKQQGVTFAYNETPMSFGPEGYVVPHFKDKAYSGIQVGHMAFVGKNGSLLIVKIPNFLQLLDIIREEPRVQQQILNYQPFFSFNEEEPWGNLTKGVDGVYLRTPDDLKDLIGENAQKKHRMGQHGWTDVHSILAKVPIDIVDWVKKGHLEVLLSKPGALDKKTFLETIHA